MLESLYENRMLVNAYSTGRKTCEMVRWEYLRSRSEQNTIKI